MSLKDFIGMRVKYRNSGENETKRGVIVDFYLRGDSQAGGRQIERFVVLTDENHVIFRDVDQSPGIIFDDDDHLNNLRNKLLNVKLEDDTPTPREDLLDLED